MQPRDLMRILILFCLRFAFNFLIVYLQKHNAVPVEQKRLGTLDRGKSWRL